jgi:hypothetical protein
VLDVEQQQLGLGLEPDLLTHACLNLNLTGSNLSLLDLTRLGLELELELEREVVDLNELKLDLERK